MDAHNADPSNFTKTEPDLFYTQSAPKPGIGNISLVKSYSFDTMMNEFFRSSLEGAGFAVTDLPQTFGEGKLYEISLVPAEDSVIIATWKDLPQQ